MPGTPPPPPPSSDDSATMVAAMDRAGPWRTGRYLDAIGSAIAARLAEPQSWRRVLVAEPGRGSIGRALADRLAASAEVVVVAGDPADAPPSPGGSLDDRFVERRPHAASIDIRSASAGRWPLSAEDGGTFDLVLVAGGLADAAAGAGTTGRLLDDARTCLQGGGHLLLVDDDPGGLALHPPVPLFETAWRHRLTRRSIRGCEDGLIRRVPAVLDRHRLRPVTAGVTSFGGLEGEPEFPGVVQLLAELVGGPVTDAGPASRPRPAWTGGAQAGPGARSGARSGAGPADADGPGADRVAEALRRWARHPGAAVWWPLAWVLAERD